MQCSLLAGTRDSAIPRSAATKLQANRGTTAQCGNTLNSLRVANSRSCRHSRPRYSEQRLIERGTATESHTLPERRVQRTTSLVRPLTTRLLRGLRFSMFWQAEEHQHMWYQLHTLSAEATLPGARIRADAIPRLGPLVIRVEEQQHDLRTSSVFRMQREFALVYRFATPLFRAAFH